MNQMDRCIAWMIGVLLVGLWAPGEAQSNQLLLTARYLQSVHAKIEKKWDIRGLPVMELHRRSTTLTVWIGKRGSLLKVKVAQSSGIKKVDASLVKAAKKAAPFAHPHPSLYKMLRTVGMDIVFRRRVFRRGGRKKLRRSYKNVVTAPSWRPKVYAPSKRKKPKKR